MVICCKPPNTDRFSDLWAACFTGQVDRIIARIKTGDPVNGKDQEGFAPIHRAAQGGHMEAVTILMEHKANPRLPSNSGLTALHLAAFHRHVGVVNELLNTPAKQDLNSKDKHHGMTPLHMAINRGAPDVAEVLLKSGADPLIRDNAGFCAMPSAEFWGEQENRGLVNSSAKHKATYTQLVKLNCPQPHDDYFEQKKQSTVVQVAS